jgi:signal transduction histidine kinase
MKWPAWLRDSITLRFARAIAGTAVLCIAFNLLADAVFGGPALQPLAATAFSVDWRPAAPPGGPETRVQLNDVGSTLEAALPDGSALIFTPKALYSGFRDPRQWALRIGILAVVILVVSLANASRLAAPIDAFAAAARRFGADPKAPPMTPQGPAEMQHAIAAFNTMQAQIQRFVAGQSAMFAAISHDLRTPLTRMRLRGEFIEDSDQQARLFRDIDEMQTMIESVLTFLRDNAADEQTTTLDLAELLRSIADDQADAGGDVTYAGPSHVAFPGRPIGLRRAFGNLVDNAVKYGARATIVLQRRPGDVQVTITDQGPGIPADALERVFAPFQRLEPSRNRNTGGMGLGLTAARAGFGAHGGSVSLANAAGGGLRATVVLPINPSQGVSASA